MFVDRSEAGAQLAARLLEDPLISQARPDELLILSIPRGGVVVGAAVAQALHCPHEVVAVKKIGFPGQEELAIGAMAEDGTMVLHPQITHWFQEEDDYVTQAVERVKVQLETYIQKFRQGRALELKSKMVIVVDDGIATGETAKAVVMWLRSRDPAQRPKQVLVAAPVCSPAAVPELEALVDKLICLAIPEQFWAVGQFYWDFDQVSDEEVQQYLSKSRDPSALPQSEPGAPS